MIEEKTLLPEIPVLVEYLQVKDEITKRLDKLNAITVLTEDNKKEVKTSIAEINKVKDRIARYRIDETNKFMEYINPYVIKCKELEKLCVDGVAGIKAKVSELEEKERQDKIATIKQMFDFQMEDCKFCNQLKFELFFEKSMANKGVSIPQLEKKCQEWRALKEQDLNFIQNNTDEPEAVMTIYLSNGLNLPNAINEYQERFKSESEIKAQIAVEQAEQVAQKQTFEKCIDIRVTIKQLPKSKVSALQAFLNGLGVDFDVEKVEQ